VSEAKARPEVQPNFAFGWRETAPTRSEILGDFMAKRAEARGHYPGGSRTGLQRFATTDEVANMIVYACSEQASATSGAALRIDGGVVRFIG